MYTKFHENPTVGLAAAAAARPHVDLHVRHSFFFFYFKRMANDAVWRKRAGRVLRQKHFFLEENTPKPSLGGPGSMLQFRPATLQMGSRVLHNCYFMKGILLVILHNFEI